MSLKCLSLSILVPYAWAQVTLPPPPPVELQCNDYNSPPGSRYAQQAADVIAAADVGPDIAHAAQVAIDFERSNWATGSVFEDPFYALPPNASGACPGDVLKVEEVTNATLFTIPPQVGMSRFSYQTADFNGTSVPTSAYVLWPYMPRSFPNITGAPVIAWAHGTSGLQAECAPSHIQGLWYQYNTPFALALQGYVVIGTDYAGLGINKTADGKKVNSQWAANPAAANDLAYSVEAARKIWPSELSKNFVVMGHSQGGGNAWGYAQRQAQQPLDGYLGTVAASPSTDYIEYTKLNASSAGPFVTLALSAVTTIFPEYTLDDFLTPVGKKAFSLYNDLSGCQGLRSAVAQSRQATYLQSNWSSGWVFDTFNNLVANGGRPFDGPLLVIQGTADPVVNATGTTKQVNATCENIDGANLQYVMLEGSSHIPTLYSSYYVWLDWIADRFNGRPTPKMCTSTYLKPARPIDTYQQQLNYYLERPLYAYETA